MDAHDWLSTWIAPRHLAPGALEGARAAYQSRPGRWVTLDRFLPERLAKVLSRFLTKEVRFSPGYGLKGRYGFVSRAEFEAAPPEGRLFRLGRLSELNRWETKRPGYRALSALSEAFNDPRLRGLFEGVVGQPLGGVTPSARRMGRGDLLADHTDDIRDRAIAWVIYLTPGWRREEGGLLQIEDGEGPWAEIVPLYNRIAIFDVRSWHRVTAVAPGVGPHRARVTLGGWYRRPA